MPMFGRCNVNISPVSCVFSGCHANLVQTFIRVTGKDDGLIFDRKARKNKRVIFCFKKVLISQIQDTASDGRETW